MVYEFIFYPMIKGRTNRNTVENMPTQRDRLSGPSNIIDVRISSERVETQRIERDQLSDTNIVPARTRTITSTDNPPSYAAAIKTKY